ncbi:antitoxin HicB [Gellertiella hungarica]|uniref:Antitoxin HicB n=2 Tax=Gellertiella hungarica TaxID=1572859 RepID=A0A7W6J6G5_9HYPH|nr:antitoxin HicB [Gellertiella hungarica]
MTLMNCLYRATVRPDPDGGFLVTFSDVPEAVTHGKTRAEALASAGEALGLALRGIVADGGRLPEARAIEGVPVSPAAQDVIKLAVIAAFQEAAITKTELARRLGRTETEARRILDPDHGTKLPLLQQALEAMGKRLVISLMDAP